MNIFLDESGNTGCVINNNNVMNFGSQRHFALCGVIAQNEYDEKMLRQKYIALKEKHQITDELKGSSLLTRKNNELLEYFINNILDNEHFSLCYYDKKFYLSCLLFQALLGEDFKRQFSVAFYNFASCLSFEDDILFVEYCKMVRKPTIEAIRCFLKLIVSFDYHFTSKDNNPLIMMAKKILINHDESAFIEDFLSFGSYENSNYTNVVNLNALSELIFAIKREKNLNNHHLNLYHDVIDGFSDTFISELANFQISVSFSNSKDDVLIQMADNAASIFYKVMNEMVFIFNNKTEWQKENEWILELASRLYNKISLNNIKFTVPVQNWAVAICVSQMFDEKYPKGMRNNLYFNQYYQDALYRIGDSIATADYNHDHIKAIMKK
ncbi:MAG: DUF3800 domain-containing protein [Lutisporaceae bacterium]